MTDGWTITAAIATAASAAFVAWQAFETRKATGTAQAALRSAESVALDQTRARLDDQAPRVEVHQENPAWPPLGASAVGMPQPWPGQHEWHFPRDGDVLLALRVDAVITNHSDRAVQVTFNGDLYETGTDRLTKMRHRMLLRPDETVTTQLLKLYPLTDWAHDHGVYAAGGSFEDLRAVAAGTVRVHDDRDNGVVDTWNLRLSGWPLQPDAQRDGMWRLTLPTINEEAVRCVDFEMQPPRERSYWLSRGRAEQLPEIRLGESTR